MKAQFLSLVILGGLFAAPCLWAGSVTGTIVFEGAPPKLRPVDMGSDPGCMGKHSAPVANEVLVLGEGNSLGNVFVQIKGVAGSHRPPAEPVVVDQVGCVYRPRVSGAMVGQKILFKNSDGLMHNVHGKPAANPEFNIAMPPFLKETARAFNKPEPVFPVKCDVHPWMQAYVAVMTHPFFAVTGSDGSFRIPDVPAGTYEVEVWHERLGTRSRKIEVSAKGAVTADFTMKRP